MEEHCVATCAWLQSLGSFGCSRNEWIARCARAVMTTCRSSKTLSLSVSICSSNELVSSPQVWEGAPPRTTPNKVPLACHGSIHSWEYRSSSSMSWSLLPPCALDVNGQIVLSFRSGRTCPRTWSNAPESWGPT